VVQLVEHAHQSWCVGLDSQSGHNEDLKIGTCILSSLNVRH